MAIQPNPRDLPARAPDGRLGRREFIKRAVALGCSASSIAAALAACGGGTATPMPTNAPVTPPAAASPAGGGVSPVASPTRAAGPSPAAAATAAPTSAPAASPVAASPVASPATGAAGLIGSPSKGPFGAAGGLGPGPVRRGGGGTLKILYWQAPTILNPHLAQGTKDFDASRPVYEPLAEFDNDNQLVPWLAAEIPTRENGGVAADGLSVTWQLKQGVKWSDGQPFTARDCVFTWQYVTNKATGSSTADNYAAVARVEAPDDTTVKVTFKAPTPGWYRPLTDAILPEHVFKDGVGAQARNFPANLKPVGTGPYQVDTFTPGDTIMFSINPNWRDPNGPYWDQVEWKGGGDPTSAARAVFASGEFDVAWNLQVEPSVLNPIVQRNSQGARLGFQPGFGVEQVYLNESDPNTEVDGERSHFGTPHPFLSDKAVRQALQYVADRQAITQAGYGQAGDPATTILNAPAAIIPPGLTWEFNLGTARQLLDAAGWKLAGQIRAKGNVQMNVILQTTANPVRQQEQLILKNALASVGVHANLKTVSADVFFSTGAGNPDTAAHFYADMEMFTNGPTSPDPQSYLANWTTAQIPSKANDWGLNNYARYSNPAYDRLVAASARELDPAKRQQLFTQELKVLYDDAVVIPLVARKGPFGYASALEGFQPSPWSALVWNLANCVKRP
ncbi:MAG TPA: peptide ABC transporter substrate-binding protein [Thermomicrobiales bacterium]|nr:peptide ABC transporter substrate-binding protein [Thermomicrobiales bacterium]